MKKADEKEQIVSESLLAQYQKYYRIAYGYVHNEADAMDIVQEASYKAIYHSNRLRNPQYVDTWICRIVMNAAKEFLRKNRNGEQELLTEGEVTEEGFDNLDLREAVSHLEQRDRQIIELRYFEDMELSSIAEILDENLSTVKSRLYRALKKLKLELTVD